MLCWLLIVAEIKEFTDFMGLLNKLPFIIWEGDKKMEASLDVKKILQLSSNEWEGKNSSKNSRAWTNLQGKFNPLDTIQLK